MSNLLMNQFRKMPKEKGLSSGCLLTLYYLCDLANKDTKIAFPSIATIGKEIGLSPKQVRRHTHDLVKKGYLKIVENSLGGAKGKSCRYRIFLPEIPRQQIAVDNFSTTPIEDSNNSHQRADTTPVRGSQTVVKPYITSKDLFFKYGSGWQKDPDKAYRVGLELGMPARPGEENYCYVNRIFAEMNRRETLRAA